jgi:hypothetical protein
MVTATTAVSLRFRLQRRHVLFVSSIDPGTTPPFTAQINGLVDCWFTQDVETAAVPRIGKPLPVAASFEVEIVPWLTRRNLPIHCDWLLAPVIQCLTVPQRQTFEQFAKYFFRRLGCRSGVLHPSVSRAKDPDSRFLRCFNFQKRKSYWQAITKLLLGRGILTG